MPTAFDRGCGMRDSKLDNAKGVLIFLVVFGHLLESVGGWGDPILSLFLTGIYMFHMPAFIFLAGLTSKTEGLGQRLAILVILLVAFQMLYVGTVTIQKGGFPGSLLQPYWLLWFLMSMIWWLASLRFFKKVPFALGAAIVIALVAGMLPWAGYVLSTARTLVFLPFFVAGVLYGRQLWLRLQWSSPLRYLALMVLPALAIGLHGFGIGNLWFYGSFRFDQLNVGAAGGIETRALLTACASIATISFIVAMPASKSFVSKAGRNSLSVFLVHGFFVIMAGPALAALVKETGPWMGMGLSLVASALVVAVLSADFLDNAIRRSASWIYQAFCRVLSVFARHAS